MPTPTNPRLYARARAEADRIYSTPSAYKSGFIVKKYKELGGKYAAEPRRRKPEGLTRWFKEKWGDIAGRDYPVYRPSIRVTAETPLLPSEIDPADLRRKIEEKQRIRNRRNLKPFKPRDGARAKTGTAKTGTAKTRAKTETAKPRATKPKPRAKTGTAKTETAKTRAKTGATKPKPRAKTGTAKTGAAKPRAKTETAKSRATKPKPRAKIK